MKNRQLLLLVIVCLSYITTTYAQELTIETKPTELPGELANMPLLGSSANGRYLFGGFQGHAFAFDTKTNKYTLYGDEAYTAEVVGISSDGWCLMQIADAGEQAGLAQFIKLVPLDSTYGEHSIFITSPDPNYPFFTLWNMTSDTQYFCGTIINSAWETIPIIGMRNAEGTGYTIKKLPVPDKDPLGTKPQQFRLIYVSEDGSTLAGFLIEETGNLSTIMTYRKQADGSYAMNFPADDVLFDHSISVPSYPNYEDYVTVPQDPEDPNYDEDKLQEQTDAYYDACDDYLNKLDLFCRNMTLQHYTLTIGGEGAYTLATVIESETTKDGDYITKSVKYITTDLQSGHSFLTDYPAETSKDITPRNLIGPKQELLCAVPINDRYWNAVVYTYDKKMISILDWIKRETQEDFTDFYTLTDPNSNESSVYTGWPEVSLDGQTLTFMGYTNEAYKTYHNSYIRFGKSILPITAPFPITEPQVRFDGRQVHVAEPSTIFLFNMEGELFYQSFLTAPLDLTAMRKSLPQGAYIVMAVNEAGLTSTLKVSL